MKGISLDSSFIISLAINCMLNVIDIVARKKPFLIGKYVYIETVDRALPNRKHTFQALRILKRIREGKIRVISVGDREIERALDIGNNIFFSRGKNIEIIHYGETEAVLLARNTEDKIVGIDEKTMRLLIEDPYLLRDLMERKLHRPIEINEENLERWREMIGKIKVIRSADLFTYLIRKGHFEGYPLRERLLEGGLWGLRYSGCAISDDEIKEYVRWVRREWKRRG